MSIRLIATDMDGTLFQDDHMTISPRNIAALRGAREEGAKVVLASGRSWNLLSGAVEQLGEIDYALTGNGAAVLEVSTGRWLWENCIPNALALKIVEVLHREDILFEIYCQGKNYVRLSDREAVIRNNMAMGFGAYHDSRTTYVTSHAQALAGRDVEKFNIFHVPPEKREALSREILALGPLEQASALPTNMEFSARGVNKGTALQALAGQLGLAPDQLMAFGDGENDADMLALAQWSFAMANGSPIAKKAARYPAPSNMEDGLAQMVEKYVLQ